MAVKSETSIRASSRRLNPDLRKARRKFKKFGKGVERDLKKSFGGVRRGIGQIAGLASVAGLAALGKDLLKFEGNLTRFGLAAGKSGKDLALLRDRITKVSNEFGVSRAKVLGGATAFAEVSGDTEGAIANMELFARVAVATNSSMDDIAKVANVVGSKFKGIPAADLGKAFDILAVGGRAGSVELQQFAGELGQLSSQATKFTGAGLEGLALLSAGFQSIQTDFGNSPEQARTAMKGLFIALQSRRKEFKKATKIDIEGKGLEQILQEVSRAGVDFDKIKKGLGGKAPAAIALESMAKNLGTIQRIRDESLKTSIIQNDNDVIQASAAGRIAKAWERVKNQFAKVLTPERITKLAGAFEVLVDVIAFLVDNIGSVIGAFTAFKALGFASTMLEGAAAAKKAGSALGLLGARAGAIGAALAIGLGLGKILDDLLGISDAIAGLAPKKEAAEKTGFAADRVRELDVGVRSRAKAGFALSPSEERSARLLVENAKQEGLIKDGKIAPGAAKQLGKAAIEQKPSGGALGFAKDQVNLGGETQNAAEALAFALKEVARQEVRSAFRADLASADPANAPVQVRVTGKIQGDGSILIINDDKTQRSKPAP